MDLEATEDRRKLADPVLFLRQYEGRLVVRDEIHRVPQLLSTQRGLIDQAGGAVIEPGVSNWNRIGIANP